MRFSPMSLEFGAMTQVGIESFARHRVQFLVDAQLPVRLDRGFANPVIAPAFRV